MRAFYVWYGVGGEASLPFSLSSKVGDEFSLVARSTKEKKGKETNVKITGGEKKSYNSPLIHNL